MSFLMIYYILRNTIDFFLYNLISLCYTQNVEYSRGSGIGISNRFLITGDY